MEVNVGSRRHRGSGYDRLGLMIVTHTTDYLDDCLSSVTTQTMAPSATVLVDNGSGTDAVQRLAKKYGITTVRADSPVSVSAARNIGCCALAGCDLVINLDGDDILKPSFVEVYWGTARQRRADVVFGAAELFGAQSGLEFTRDKLGPNPDLRRGNYVPANSLFSWSLWRAAGGFDPAVLCYADWDFWLSCSEQGARFEHVDEPLWCYRRHEKSMLSGSDTDERARERQMIRRKHRQHIFGTLQWRRVVWKASSVWRTRRP